MKHKGLINNFMKMLKESWLFTFIIGATWLILGMLKSFGINSLILFPFNFLTGALLGLDGGSFVGGIVGRTILLLILNSMIRPVLLNKGNKIELIKSSFKAFSDALIKKIPQYGNIKQLLIKDTAKLSYNILGFGIAFMIYPVITGNGSFQNSAVCLLSAIALFKEVKKQKGFILTVTNMLLKKNNKKQINPDIINRILSGSSLGFAATFVFSAFNINVTASYLIGGVFIAISIFLIFINEFLHKTEAKAV